ncbi:MAG: hypothetical protein GY850_40125, partial [bacterium]|nr:hypothetical protein [bacterium]
MPPGLPNEDDSIPAGKYTRLTTKVTIIIVCILLVLLLPAGFFLVNLYTEMLIESARDKGKNITALFAKINSHPLERMDFYSLENNT